MEIIKKYYKRLTENINLDEFSLLFAEKQVRKGETLYLQDASSELDGIWLVEAGLLESRFMMSTGNNIRISEYAPGSILGAVSVFDKLPQPYTISAVKDSKLFILPRGDINSIFKSNDSTSFVLKKMLLINIARELRVITNHLSQFFKIDKKEESNIVKERLNTNDGKKEDFSDYDNKFYAIKELDIFSRLDVSEIDLLTTLSQSIVFEKDQLIFSEGSLGESVYFIMDGEVRISKFFPGVGEEALVVLKKGDFFGEMAFLDPSPRSAYAISNKKTLIFSVSNQALEGLFSLNIRDANKMLNIFGYIMSTRTRKTINTLEFWKILEGNF